jgi:hypothetical protein
VHLAVRGSNRAHAWSLRFLGLLGCCTVAACVDLTPPWERASAVARDAAAEESAIIPNDSDAVVVDEGSAPESQASDAEASGISSDGAASAPDGVAGGQKADADAKAGDAAGADDAKPDIGADADDAAPDGPAAAADGPEDGPAGAADRVDSSSENGSAETHDSQESPPIGSLMKLVGTPFGTGPAYSGSPTATYDKAFDGDLATFFDDSHGSGGYTGIDLGEEAATAVAVIRFYPRRNFNDRMVGGKFQCSSSSQTDGYVDLYTIDALPPLAWTEVRVVDSPPCRFLRYLAGGGNTNVAEIEFWSKGAVDGGTGFADAGAPLSNLSLGKSVRASSEQTSAGKTAAKGNDGLLSTIFCPSSNEFPVWYEVDLNAVYPIRQTDIGVETSYTTYQYRIEVSRDGAVWTTAVNHESDAPFGPATCADSFAANARFVRLTILGVGNGYWGCFREFAIWGYDTPLAEAARN